MVSLPPSTTIVTTGTKYNKKSKKSNFYIIKSGEELLKSMFVLALRCIERGDKQFHGSYLTERDKDEPLWDSECIITDANSSVPYICMRFKRFEYILSTF
jgi:hypothetical protein